MVVFKSSSESGSSFERVTKCVRTLKNLMQIDEDTRNILIIFSIAMSAGAVTAGVSGPMVGSTVGVSSSCVLPILFLAYAISQVGETRPVGEAD